MKSTSALRRFSSRIAVAVMLIAVFAAGIYVGGNHLNVIAQPEVGQAGTNTLPPRDAEERFLAFWEVYNLIQKNYLDAPEPDVLVDGAIKGLIEALDDEYSGYVEPRFSAFVNDLSGEIQGIGVVITKRESDGLIEVSTVLQGTPAENAGVRQGDLFIVVDGEDVTDVSTTELAARVRGQQGTMVNITMRRGEEEIEFSIERARIVIPNIETDIVGDNIAYIRLNEFTANARQDLDRALAETDALNRSGLILDLRNNPGGLLSSAVNVASAFLERGDIVLYETFGDGTEEIFEANGSSVNLNTPFVILVNGSSASGSELVVGAWQDNGIGTVIGETTFGKGTVQTQNSLTNGGSVRLTIARWLRPNREWIHGVGITPEIVVEWTPEAREADPETDPQLNAAIELIAEQISN
jgi:carboxyl-terminal processing protease